LTHHTVALFQAAVARRCAHSIKSRFTATELYKTVLLSAIVCVFSRTAVPAAEFRQGDLFALPVESSSVDLAVGALALTHCPDLLPPIRELARVVRLGGYILISDFHPFMIMLGGTAFFVAADGSAGYVTTYLHYHSAYLRAFQHAGLVVEQCLEPVHGENEVVLMSTGMMDVAGDAFRSALLGVPGALVWLLRRPSR